MYDSLITGTRRHDHITLVLRQLHWLQIRKRIDSARSRAYTTSRYPARHLFT